MKLVIVVLIAFCSLSIAVLQANENSSVAPPSLNFSTDTQMGDLIGSLLEKIGDNEPPEDHAALLETFHRLGYASSQSLQWLGSYYLEQNLPELAIPVFNQSLTETPAPTFASSLEIAKLLISNERLEECSEFLVNLRNSYDSPLSKSDEESLLNIEVRIAKALDSKSRFVSILEKLNEIDPLDIGSVYMLIDHYLNQGDEERAKSLYDRIRISDIRGEDYWKPRFLFVDYYVRTEQYGKAIPFLEGSYIYPNPRIGVYLEQIRKKDARSEVDWDTRVLLMDYYIRTEQYEKAIPLMEGSPLQPNSPRDRYLYQIRKNNEARIGIE